MSLVTPASTPDIMTYRLAALELKAATPASVTSDQEVVRKLNEIYDHTIEFCALQHDWRDFRTTALMTGVSTTEYQPYAYEYTRPTGYLRVSRVRRPGAGDRAPEPSWEQHGGVLYGDESTMEIIYVDDRKAYVTSNWNALYRGFVAKRLALECAPKLAEYRGDVDKLMDKSVIAMKDAINHDLSETSYKRPPVGRWARAHFRNQSILGNL